MENSEIIMYVLIGISGAIGYLVVENAQQNKKIAVIESLTQITNSNIAELKNMLITFIKTEMDTLKDWRDRK